uniref:Outer membrane lipoprotein carrier protein LolA n=1 Tax=candidate division WOR-3 bacterium TaxID=2052148 RepID=A0A7V3KP64_UNCW3
MIFILLLLNQIDSTLLANLKEKPFKTEFVEVVQYKEMKTQDTFRGNLTRKGSNIKMEVVYPSKETYLIRNDTLFVISQGKVTSYPLEEDALKLLNFQFLSDTINYELKVSEDTLYLKSKKESLFLMAKLVIQKGIPEILSIEDEEKILKFSFKKWKFYE